MKTETPYTDMIREKILAEIIRLGPGATQEQIIKAIKELKL